MEELTRKQKGFVKDLRDKIKTQIKGLTPEQLKLRSEVIEAKSRQLDKEEWKERWKTTEEDFWRFVYVMNCGKFFKIGIAIRLDERLNQVQTGNPYQVSLVFGIKHKNAEEIERELHNIFIDKRERREWFILEDKDLVFIREFIENYGKS